MLLLTDLSIVVSVGLADAVVSSGLVDVVSVEFPDVASVGLSVGLSVELSVGLSAGLSEELFAKPPGVLSVEV